MAPMETMAWRWRVDRRIGETSVGGGAYRRHQGRSRGGLRDVRVGYYIDMFSCWGFALDAEPTGDV